MAIFWTRSVVLSVICQSAHGVSAALQASSLSSAHVMRREAFMEVSDESANATSVEDELARIVYESLSPTGRSEVTATMSRPGPPSKNSLTQMCVLGNMHSDTRPFLASQKYHAEVQQAKNAVSSKKLIVAGLWRQIGAEAVEHLWAALSALGSFFSDYQFIMLENDSSDSTKAGIRTVCADSDRAWCYTLTGMKSPVLHAGVAGRVRGLTALRQVLLAKVREFDPSGSFDYLMMVDGDIFAEGNAGFDVAGALTAFNLMAPNSGQPPPADGVCAYQVAGSSKAYYDTFAHRGPHCPYEQLSEHPFCPASSCGGGMVVYSMKALQTSKCGYTYVDEGTCEHIPLNECLARNGFGKLLLYKPWSVAMSINGDRSDWNCMAV